MTAPMGIGPKPARDRVGPVLTGWAFFTLLLAGAALLGHREGAGVARFLFLVAMAQLVAVLMFAVISAPPREDRS